MIPLRQTMAALTLASLACAAHAQPDAPLPGNQPNRRAEAQPAAPPTDEWPPAEQQLGARIEIFPEDLPPPNPESAANNPPLIVPRGDRKPNVPPGFTATLFAAGLTHPRRLLVLPNGDVILAEQNAGYLTFLRDGDGDGRAEWIERHAEGFNAPYGLAWRDGHILVADQVGIWSVPHTIGQVRGGHGEPKPISEVPPDQRKPDPNVYGQELITGRNVFGLIAGHVNRDLEIGRDSRLYIGVGSSGNIGVEPEVKATIQTFSHDGKDQQTYASGMRNPTDLAFHPETGALWAIVQERDGLGDALVPDYLVQAKPGAFYGWPYSYIGSNPQPGFAESAPEKVRAAVVPDLLFQAHSSAMGLAFYTGEGNAKFPDEYHGDAFVALKGSWNSSQPNGYKVVRVSFGDGGRPENGGYENFVTGFWVGGAERAEVWGRPAALAIAKDGALLIADDTGGTIWRVAYTGSDEDAQAGVPESNEPPGARR